MNRRSFLIRSTIGTSLVPLANLAAWNSGAQTTKQQNNTALLGASQAKYVYPVDLSDEEAKSSNLGVPIIANPDARKPIGLKAGSDVRGTPSNIPEKTEFIIGEAAQDKSGVSIIDPFV